MPNAKEQVRQILDRLGDDATLDDIQYQIYVQQKVQRGLDDLAAGRVVNREDAEREMAAWLKSNGHE